MALVGAGCMGFWNVRRGLRAMGYTERDDLPVGPVSLVTHSGSVFSTLLRTRLRLGFDLAVSSGQELVTTTADYVDHIVDHTETRVLALVLETIRGGDRLRWSLRRAREAGIEVVLLPVGHSPLGSAMVAAHSGAVAGGSAAWEALTDDVAGHLVGDLAELADTLAVLASPRRPRPGGALATVHDSGAERSLVADLAHQLDVPFASLGERDPRRARAPRLDDGLEPGNPLDVWGGGADTRQLFGDCLTDIAADPAVGVTALAVDLVPEYDGDTAYPDAVLDVVAATDQPVVVLAGLSVRRRRGGRRPAARGRASRCSRASAAGCWPCATCRRQSTGRRPTERGDGQPRPTSRRGLLTAVLASRPRRRSRASTRAAAQAAAAELGWPVVLKTAASGVVHRSDVGGVVADLHDLAAVGAAYDDLADRLGPDVTVHQQVPAGVEVSVGFARDEALGPDGRGRGRRGAGRAAHRPSRRAAAAHPRRGAPDARPARDCGRCSTGGAARRPPTSRRWPTSWWRCLGSPHERGDELAALDLNPVIVTRRGRRRGRRPDRAPHRPPRGASADARPDRAGPGDPAPGAGVHRHLDPLRGGGRAGGRRAPGRAHREVPPRRPRERPLRHQHAHVRGRSRLHLHPAGAGAGAGRPRHQRPRVVPAHAAAVVGRGGHRGAARALAAAGRRRTSARVLRDHRGVRRHRRQRPGHDRATATATTTSSTAPSGT